MSDDIVLRCQVSNNPCGTDTRPVGADCQCRPCRLWLRAFREGRDAVLEEAARVCDDRVFSWRPCESSKAAACCAEAIRALKATPAPITPSAVDEAERRGAERATAQVVAWLEKQPPLSAGPWELAEAIKERRHIPPATESEAGRG